jgi:hypothetical protein
LSQKLGPAASPVPIPAGTAAGTHDDVGVLALDELPPPPGTTHLLVLFYPDRTVDESDYTNDFAAVRVVLPPKVEVVAQRLSADGSFSTATDQVFLNEPYYVVIRVTNVDTEPHNYHVDFSENLKTDLVDFTGLYSGPGSFDTGILQPNATYTATLGEFKHRWDWIPANSPFDQNLTSQIKNLILNKIVDELEQLLPSIAKPLEPAGIGPIVDAIINAGLIFKFIGSVEQDNGVVEYSATVSSADSASTTAQDQITLEVPDSKEHTLRAYLASRFLPDLITNASVPSSNSSLLDLVIRDILTSLNRIGQIDYGLAYDPPDSDYTEIPKDSPRYVPSIDSLPAGVFKDFATAVVALEATVSAHATSINRAQGAAAAGNPLWEYKQLSAAADFALQASKLETRLSRLASLTCPPKTGPPEMVESAGPWCFR